MVEVEQQHINFQAEVHRPTQPPVNLVPPADKSLITLDLQVLSDDRYEISYSENKVVYRAIAQNLLSTHVQHKHLIHIGKSQRHIMIQILRLHCKIKSYFTFLDNALSIIGWCVIQSVWKSRWSGCAVCNCTI
ncbi:hypothetical protein TOT_030000010 [Theileria orientalis strain Shintoku]|uniref:Uncharacterized protein n=1 Tax=Theileria orientalis strain Shintoku TaxID=869250 RepID=J4C8G5_THEOR|nr:hypothetical protein TOT_030000010 [Theileria orientalis strain Shintoku]BAM40748.1 hypothetical protein TOT_030000010 [Theileria orientalis strain Shintoku]|eukprot:XP_009691049.1 hypothetical protein TOT_030000010 [Theileria orientalis strain Shintoku]